MKRNNTKRNGYNRKKASALLTSLIVLLCVAVASTAAFLIVKGVPLTNIFHPSDVTTEVTEKFDGSTKTNVAIKNTGKTDAYIRAAIVVTWKDNDKGNGNVYAGQPVAGTDYTIELNTEDWFEKDGFYYCKTPVAPGGANAVVPDHATPVLIYSCSPIAGRTPDGYGLNVEILGSGIQSVPTTAVASAWGVTVAEDGTISK